MKIAKIPYSAAEVEVIFFSVEDIVTSSVTGTDNMEQAGQGGIDWEGDDDWGTGW